MTSERDSKGGEGRGLPVGWGWRAWYRYSSLHDTDGIEQANAHDDGDWHAVLDDMSTIKGTAKPRDGESAGAAAQREAEAALWRVDGFGTGEVRGRFVAHGRSFGLPGPWRTKAIRAVPGGHEIDAVREGVEVDAVRAPSPLSHGMRVDLTAEEEAAFLARIAAAPVVGPSEAEAAMWVDAVRAPVEPAPHPLAASLATVEEGYAAPLPCPDCGRRECFAGVRQCDAAKRAESGDPAPPWNWCPACSQAIDIGDESHEGGEVRCLGCRAWYVVCRDGEGKWWLEAREEHDEEDKGKPAPREPPAPTDGAELARLLPMLPSVIDEVRALPHGREAYLADACELLLGERAKTERRIAILTQTADAGEIAVGALERLRARAEEAERRVAELEAALEMERGLHADTFKAWEKLRDARESESATPPPAAAAALLALITRALDAFTASGESLRGGSSEDMRAHVEHVIGKRREVREALEAARATLAPSPLDGVVAEVCAVRLTGAADPTSDDIMVTIVNLAADARAGQVRNTFLVVGRLALAGALTCDEEAKGEAEEERAAACDATKGGARG